MRPTGPRQPSPGLSIREILKYGYFLFCLVLFDPREKIRIFRALPIFLHNAWRYGRLSRGPAFKLRLGDIWYRTFDRFEPAGVAAGHYFHQDLWAARILFARQVRHHVDVGSRLDGLVAHILPFCRVTYVDLRPVGGEVEGFEFRQGSILNLPFADGEVPSLSCLHVLEHIGLGRYGDRVEPEAYVQAARELARILKPGGILCLGTPVGRERLCFDAHRVFDPQRVVNIFQPLVLREFRLIDDRGNLRQPDAAFAEAREMNYGCGLFLFEKPGNAG